MTSTKELFHSKKPLRNWWAKIVEDPQFAEVLLHTRSAFIEGGLTEAQLQGAGEYERILTSLHEAEPGPVEIPSPGLHHNYEPEPPMPRAPEPVRQPQPKQAKAKKK